MKILFLPKAPDATAYFRCELPAKALAAAGHDVRSRYLEPNPGVPDSGVREEECEWADVIVVQRPLTEYALGIVRRIKQCLPRTAVVGDYDDDYYSVPTWNPGYTFVKANEPHWQAMVAEMDGVVVSTDPLAEAIHRRYKGPVEAIPNGFDFETFDALPPPPPFPLAASRVGADGRSHDVAYTVGSEEFNELMRDRVVVAWAGSQYHFSDLARLAPCVPEIMRRHPEVTLLFVGYVTGDVLRGAPLSRVFTCGGRFPATAFHGMLRALKIDVMLAPLEPVEFNASKSNLKVMEAMALGAYPVCSKFDPYQDDLDLEELAEVDPDDATPRHGRLVPYRRGAWADAVSDAVRVVTDPIERDRCRRDNAEFVRSRHAAPLRAPLYEEFFTRILEAKR